MTDRPAPSFALSRTSAPDDDFAAWQARLDAARVSTPAAERNAAACLAAEAIVCGRPARGWGRRRGQV